MNDTFEKWEKDMKIILQWKNTMANTRIERWNSQKIKCISQE